MNEMCFSGYFAQTLDFCGDFPRRISGWIWIEGVFRRNPARRGLPVASEWFRKIAMSCGKHLVPGDPVLSWVAPDRTLTTTDLSVIVLPYCLPQIRPTCYLDWHCSVDWCLAEPPK